MKRGNTSKMSPKGFSKLEHLGVIVRDLDKAIRFYESLGIGPFEEMSADVMSGLTDKTMYGVSVDFELRAAVAKMGGVNLELIQPVKDAPLMENFLKTKGEGIHHLGFLVDNLEEETVKLTGKGCRIILSVKLPDGRGAVYLDTGKVGGVVTEFLQS